MKDLRITMVQTSLHWENQQRNLEMFEKLLSGIKKGSTDLIVLPEMFATGFTMNVKKVADVMDGDAVAWMKKISLNKNAGVCGSLVIKSKNKFYNRLICMMPDGFLKTYDKRHLFRMAKEHRYYTAGQQKLIVKWKGWTICPLVCYDLRFPVWSRNEKRNPYDVLIYVANWPERRRNSWQVLGCARAIENQSYVVAVNRIGKDGNGIVYSGDSAVFDPHGIKISKTIARQTSVETVNLSSKKLMDWRKIFPALTDADTFKIKF